MIRISRLPRTVGFAPTVVYNVCHMSQATVENIIKEIEIRWPSGLVERLTDLAADRFYNVLEGKGVVDPKVARPSPAKH